MEYSIIQVALVFVVTFIAAIDQFNFLESLYQPIVTGAVIGLILGDLNTGLLVGGTYQLMTIGNMPIGGAQPPNAVIGDSEDQAEQSHGEVVQTLDTLGVSVVSHVVRRGHERRHKREDQGNAELTEQGERNGKADGRVGLEARGDSQNGCPCT